MPQPRLLVVEDDPGVRTTIVTCLELEGYAVDAASLPDVLEQTLVNLNDGTNEGFRHRELAVEAVQFHPEASPGPFDARDLFAHWLQDLVRR